MNNPRSNSKPLTAVTSPIAGALSPGQSPQKGSSSSQRNTLLATSNPERLRIEAEWLWKAASISRCLVTCDQNKRINRENELKLATIANVFQINFTFLLRWFSIWPKGKDSMNWWMYFQLAFNCPHEVEWMCGMSVTHDGESQARRKVCHLLHERVRRLLMGGRYIKQDQL